MFRQRFDADGLRGVMSCVDEVDSPLFRLEIRIVRPLAGQERIAAGSVRIHDSPPPASRDDAYPFDGFRASCNHKRIDAKHVLDTANQLITRYTRIRPYA